MEVLLINPPYNPNMRASLIEPNMIPLGIGFLAGSLKSAGISVKVLDALSMNQEEIASYIRDSGAGIFGITTYTHSVNQVRQLCTLIRNNKPDSLIILGGHHFDEQSSPHFLSKVPEADVVVMGEGEEVLLNLINSYLDKGNYQDIQCIVYRSKDEGIIKNGGIAYTADINKLPLFPYHFFDLSQYRSVVRGVVSKHRIDRYCKKYKIKNPLPQGVLFSKGCIGKCTFCGIFYKNSKLRVRDIKHIFSDILALINKYNYRFIRFVSANMGNERFLLEELCRKLIGLRLDIMWDADIRIDCVDEDLIKLMSKAGCYALFFGVESGSETVQRMAYKAINRDKLVRTVELCKKYEIEPILSFIAGLPGETYETYMETVGLIYKIGNYKPEIRCKPAFVLPRTLLFQIMKDRGLLDDDYWFTPSDLPIFTGSFEAEEVKGMSQKITWHGFLSRRKNSLLKSKKNRGFLVIGADNDNYSATIVEMLAILYPQADIYVKLKNGCANLFQGIPGKVSIIKNDIDRKNYDHVFYALNGKLKNNMILQYCKYILFKPCTYIDFPHQRILPLPFYYFREVVRKLKIHLLLIWINDKFNVIFHEKAGWLKVVRRVGGQWGTTLS